MDTLLTCDDMIAERIDRMINKYTMLVYKLYQQKYLDDTMKDDLLKLNNHIYYNRENQYFIRTYKNVIVPLRKEYTYCCVDTLIDIMTRLNDSVTYDGYLENIKYFENM